MGSEGNDLDVTGEEMSAKTLACDARDRHVAIPVVPETISIPVMCPKFWSDIVWKGASAGLCAVGALGIILPVFAVVTPMSGAGRGVRVKWQNRQASITAQMTDEATTATSTRGEGGQSEDE